MTTNDTLWKFVFRYYLEDTRIWSSYYLAYYNNHPVICFVHHNGVVWALFKPRYTAAQYLYEFNNQLESCITNTTHIPQTMLVKGSSNYSSLPEVLRELERLSIVELL